MSSNKRFTGDFTIESIDSGSRIESHADGTLLIGDATTIIPILDGVEGGRYKIATVGTTDFTLLGSEFNVIETVFTMNAVAPLGTGTVQLVSVLTVDGDLTVLGTATTINSIDTEIVDNIIVLNSGELGAGVTLGTSGLEIDRGSSLAAGIQFNEPTDTWQINNGDGVWTDIVSGSGFSLVTDLDPHLGGDLNVNGWDIVSDAVVDINLLPGAGGNISLSTTTTGDIILTAAEAVSLTAAGTVTLDSTAADVAITGLTGVTITATDALADIVLSATGAVKVEQEITLFGMAVPPSAETGYSKLYAGTTIGPAGTGLYVVSDDVSDELVSRRQAIKYSLIF